LIAAKIAVARVVHGTAVPPVGARGEENCRGMPLARISFPLAHR
jgi:hypothetical protein